MGLGQQLFFFVVSHGVGCSSSLAAGFPRVTLARLTLAEVGSAHARALLFDVGFGGDRSSSLI